MPGQHGGYRGGPPRQGGGHYPGGGQNTGTDRSVASLDEIFPDYLKEGYFDDEKNIRPALVSRGPMKKLVDALASGNLTTNQIRRFFQHCRAVEANLRSGKSAWQEERGTFLLLDVAAADAAGKKPPKIPALFHEFIRRNVQAVKTREDFLNGFLPHFQALIGFGSGRFGNERN